MAPDLPQWKQTWMPCPAPERRAKEQECNVGPCPMDCVVSKWTNLNTCSASCGGGTVTQVRSILSPAMYGGAACPAKLQRVAECNIDMCPVDCKVSEWRDEGECSATCGGGTLNRTRSIEVAP